MITPDIMQLLTTFCFIMQTEFRANDCATHSAGSGRRGEVEAAQEGARMMHKLGGG